MKNPYSRLLVTTTVEEGVFAVIFNPWVGYQVIVTDIYAHTDAIDPSGLFFGGGGQSFLDMPQPGNSGAPQWNWSGRRALALGAEPLLDFGEPLSFHAVTGTWALRVTGFAMKLPNPYVFP